MKLLSRSIRAYLIYSTIILAVAIPVFYVVIQQIVTEDVDESLAVRKKETLEHFTGTARDPLTGITGPDMIIRQVTGPVQPDTFYTYKQYDDLSKEDIPYRVFESDILLHDTRYRLRLRSSLVDSDELISSIVTVMIVLLLLIFAGLLLINRFSSKKLWAPFYDTLQQLQQYRIESNSSLELSSGKTEEFTVLNDTLQKITGRNQTMYRLQKEFTENAAHELQTPLAVLQNQVDLLMQTEPLSREQAGLLAELVTTIQRMNRLNKTLLLITKIGNQQFGQTENIPMTALVEQLLAQYKNAVLQKKLSIKKDLSATLTVQANRTLLEILTGNLLSNAIRHNNPGGSIHIQLQERALSISNDGIPTPLDTDRLFERFHKQSTDHSSLGLGLGLVKEIADNYGYSIVYNFAANQHCFTIRF